jgi:hypothetical protein
MSTMFTLYRLYNAAGELIYIGKSIHRYQRLDHHCRYQPWSNEIASAAFQELPDEATLSRVEIAAIKREHPKYNKAHVEHPTVERQTVERQTIKRAVKQVERRLSKEDAANYVRASIGNMRFTRYSDGASLFLMTRNGRGYWRVQYRDGQSFKAKMLGTVADGMTPNKARQDRDAFMVARRNARKAGGTPMTAAAARSYGFCAARRSLSASISNETQSAIDRRSSAAILSAADLMRGCTLMCKGAVRNSGFGFFTAAL